MKLRHFLPVAFFAIASCAPSGSTDVIARATGFGAALPAIKTFAPQTKAQPLRSNAEMARDFLDLSFELESGRTLPRLTRFDGPITLRVSGQAPSSLAPDLQRLVARFRQEAGLPVSIVEGSAANINVIALPKSQLQRAVPNAACFVVPNVSSWREFRANTRSAQVDWALLPKRETISVFVPSDAPPQELRDCLHEEIAQALGPLNDLYRLPDSVFNDDNIHAVLTSFDMLMLRAYYDPALRNGMSRQEAAGAIRGILARLNPRGEGRSTAFSPHTSPAWKSSINTALAGTTTPPQRQVAARQAIALAQANRWDAARLGFSHYAAGRLSLATAPARARDDFDAADRIYASSDTTQLHRGYTAVQLAAFALSSGDGERVLQIVTPQIPVAAAHEHAALLASLMMMQAEALDLVGRTSDAARIRLDSLGWARYGFGSDQAVRARLAEIERLNPQKSGRFGL